MLTLIAAWHAVLAAILACSVSMEMAAFSRSMPSRISVSSFSASFAGDAGGNGLNCDAARAHRFDLEAVGGEFVGDFFVDDELARGKFENHRHQHALAFDFAGATRFEMLLEEDALVRDVLIDDPEAFAVDGDDEAGADLAERF